MLTFFKKDETMTGFLLLHIKKGKKVLKGGIMIVPLVGRDRLQTIYVLPEGGGVHGWVRGEL